MQPLRPTLTPDATRDQRLWQIAKARTKFQGHLLTYLIVNAGLWLLWAFTTRPFETHHHHDYLPWPIWSTVFWGVGVAAQGLAAYGSLNRGERTQREYERLRAKADYEL
ncbi:2TM domain-containing protein [Hymenobacter cheonanensis]|uniref:2TM domain-containing protein n=1 Tax=Hymenobacter sp. CA2-7 TaxID=3063993 RepID=UPI002712D157|nr:2TM domain-containing protein [Hymenobacter sp. CA2-7]MDO7888105.1 2TM domain-containing protein [Hymenobacter sp. CA2-7]